ncbi:sulfite exporter TauE/SafE family protein [Williamsoniiplasma luminosum]|uniref:Uncharacterized protein n=1 Tax=Williamsoniiplasma luminosum TaxID=214888 RepID=A0A2S0NKN2_9MOLU|nr:sulfite exporter TauE/SafE family protein [Williamsoniiplasma luminosum]AVP49562.1 MAG: hypothetical protein C5T88_03225 [Williamsoniiplasma luminosum]
MNNVLEQKKAKEIISNENQFSSAVESFSDNTLSHNELKRIHKVQLKNLNHLKRKQKITEEQFNVGKQELESLFNKYESDIKNNIDVSYSVAIQRFENTNEEKKQLNLNNFQIWKQQLGQIKLIKNDTVLSKEAKKEKIKAIKSDYQKLYRRIMPKKIALMSIIALPIVIVVSLLCSYLVYFPVDNGAGVDFTQTNHLVAFILAMVALILMCGFMWLLLKNTTRRIFLDNDQSLGKMAIVGFIGSFVDTIGVGSFAVTVAALKGTNAVKDSRLLPGTLNMGLAIPNLLAGAIFVSAISVELATLLSLIVAGMVGAFLGSKLVKFVSAKYINLGMSVALLVVAVIMVLVQTKVLAGGNATGLTGWKLALGIVLFVIIGGLQSFGIGFYSPALAVISLLGMDLVTAFPIMTCAAGFGIPMGCWSFNKDNNYLPKVTFGLMIGGIFGSFIAFLLVFIGIKVGLGVSTDDFTYVLKWFAVAILCYGSVMLFLNFWKAHQNDKKHLGGKEPDINYFATLSSVEALKAIEKKFDLVYQTGLKNKDVLEALIVKENIKKQVWK